MLTVYAMKSQDILLLLKLVALEKYGRRERALLHESEADYTESLSYVSSEYVFDWKGWEVSPAEASLPMEEQSEDRYSLRSLATMTGISKSEVGESIKRSKNVRLLVEDHKTHLPKVNIRALKEFIFYGLKYVFPAIIGPVKRGIPTSFAAPVMQGKLMTAGSMIYVWPDFLGKEQGQSVAPLFKSVPGAVKRDPELYRLLALVDAIRLGSARESQFAIELLDKELK